MATKKPSKPRRKPTKKTAKPAGAVRKAGAGAVSAPTGASRLGASDAGRAPRRAVFIDVENTSSEESLAEVLEGLKIDRAAQPTELTAVGNWRTVGQRMGRHLASLGAQLVHSAPATGVRDWSDLWIAVAAGCWLGQSAPGDTLEIVSNDRAFDAVGDAAAARGVIYHRFQHRRGALAAAEAAEPEPASSRRSRGGRRRRRGGGSQVPRAVQAAARSAPPPAPPMAIEPHSATREQMISVIGRLSGGDSNRWVNLDVLEKGLKAEGFSRPPGSPRLVTRLRMLKEVEVDSHGRVRLAPATAVATSVESEAAPATPAKRRRRRRSKAGSGAAAAATAPVEAQPL